MSACPRFFCAIRFLRQLYPYFGNHDLYCDSGRLFNRWVGARPQTSNIFSRLTGSTLFLKVRRSYPVPLNPFDGNDKTF